LGLSSDEEKDERKNSSSVARLKGFPRILRRTPI
jgi:hypothetical protein